MVKERGLDRLTANTISSNCELVGLQALGSTICGYPVEHGIRFLNLGGIVGVWGWSIIWEDEFIACLSYEISQETVMSIWTFSKLAFDWPLRDIAVIRSLPALKSNLRREYRSLFASSLSTLLLACIARFLPFQLGLRLLGRRTPWWSHQKLARASGRLSKVARAPSYPRSHNGGPPALPTASIKAWLVESRYGAMVEVGIVYRRCDFWMRTLKINAKDFV